MNEKENTDVTSSLLSDSKVNQSDGSFVYQDTKESHPLTSHSKKVSSTQIEDVEAGNDPVTEKHLTTSKPFDERSASWSSRWTFSYLGSLVSLGWSRTLEESDLPEISQHFDPIISHHLQLIEKKRETAQRSSLVTESQQRGNSELKQPEIDPLDDGEEDQDDSVAFYPSSSSSSSSSSDDLKQKGKSVSSSPSLLLCYNLIFSCWRHTKKFLFRRLGITETMAQRSWVVSQDFFRLFGKKMIFPGFCKVIGDILSTFPPLILFYLLNLFSFAQQQLENGNDGSDSNPSLSSNSTDTRLPFMSFSDNPHSFHFWIGGYLAAFLMFGCFFLSTVFLHQHHYRVMGIGMQAKLIFIQIVYRKLLRLNLSITSPIGEDDDPADSNSSKKGGVVIINENGDKENLFIPSQGSIASLVTSDTDTLQRLFWFASYLFASPIQISITMAFLIQQVGWMASLGAVIMIILMIILQTLLSGRIVKVVADISSLTDRRVFLISELLQGIRNLKMYAWEKYGGERATEMRNAEVQQLKKWHLLSGINDSLLMAGPTIVAMVVFIIFPIAEGEQEFTITRAFTALSLLNILRLPFSVLPMTFTALSGSIVAFDRLFQLLSLPEKVASVYQLDTEQSQSLSDSPSFEEVDDSLLKITNATISWNDLDGPLKNPQRQLKESLSSPPSSNTIWRISNINLTGRAGQLIVIVGPVGGGKTTLLHAILREAKLSLGSLHVGSALQGRPKTPFCPQQPWIFNATLKENILFELPLEQEIFDQVIDICALEPDLELLSAREEAEIGERGTNLSGGQKARVSLARAIYSTLYHLKFTDPDIHPPPLLLLDDVLSALDAHVSFSVLRKCITSPSLSSCLRILATHNLSSLAFADQILVLGRPEDRSDWAVESNSISFEDPPANENVVLFQWSSGAQSLQHQSIPLAFGHYAIGSIPLNDSLGLSSDSPNLSHSRETKDPILKYSLSSSSTLSSPHTLPSLSEDDDHSNESNVTESQPLSPIEELEIIALDPESPSSVIEALDDGSLTVKEKRQTGRIRLRVIGYYFKSLGIVLFSLIVLALVIQNLLTFAVSFWMSIWANEIFHWTMMEYIAMYSLFSILVCLSLLVYKSFWSFAAIKAAKKIHRLTLFATLMAPIRFFDQNPPGRLMSRFAGDIFSIDRSLPNLLSWSMAYVGMLISTIIMISVLLPYMLLLLIPLLGVYVWTALRYTSSSRELRRLEKMASAPVYSHISSSYEGLSTIRAFEMEEAYLQKLYSLQYRNCKCFYYTLLLNRWLGVRIEFLGALVVFFVCLFSVGMTEFGSLSAGIAAVVLTQALSITGIFNTLIRWLTDCETELTSVERLAQYLEDIKPEGQKEGVELLSPQSLQHWPSEGRIVFHDFSLRYDISLPLILKHINVCINPYEKIGVCGRTGAGKSSMIAALLRLIESDLGRIEIDGIDISKIPLDILRSRIAIIPQSPFLFSGTIRFNLDPMGKSTDQEIWASLTAVRMKTAITNLPGKLDFEIKESGATFSAGEQQLLCFSRAILQRAKILILDEATASVDSVTDDVIQEMIRSVFSGVTIFTIAHRISTIAFYDKILVLEKGSVAEFGEPQQLLAKKRGMFWRLWKADKSQPKESNSVPGVD